MGSNTGSNTCTAAAETLEFVVISRAIPNAESDKQMDAILDLLFNGLLVFPPSSERFNVTISSSSLAKTVVIYALHAVTVMS